MTHIFKLKLDGKKKICMTNAINLSYNKYVIDALAKNDRDIAINGLKNLSKVFKEYTFFRRIKIHIHTANVHSLVRLWNLKKYGDDLSGFRETINYVAKTHKPLKAFEIGKAGLLLRGIAPVMKNGEYLGSVEFIQGLNSISRTLQKHNIYPFFRHKQQLQLALHRPFYHKPTYFRVLQLLKSFVSFWSDVFSIC